VAASCPLNRLEKKQQRHLKLVKRSMMVEHGSWMRRVTVSYYYYYLTTASTTTELEGGCLLADLTVSDHCASSVLLWK
jgi:hypothetical protein